MSTTLLQDLIGKIKADYGQVYEDAKAGKTPSSAFDGPPLPLNLEYRAVVDSATYGKSKSSGRDQITLTYEIVEPAEYAGRKVQDYHSPAPTNPIGTEQLAKLFGALKADLDGWGEDMEKFVSQFEGKTLVLALRTWGEDEDRFGVRWVNPDYGQTLKTDVKPPKTKGGTSSLTSAPPIPTPQTPEAPAAVTPPPSPLDEASTPAAAPAAVTPPPAVNLPPGLRG